MKDQKYINYIIECLLEAETVEDFDNVIKFLVFNRGIPILRRMIEDRKKIENKYCFYIGWNR